MRAIWHNGTVKEESAAVVSLYDQAMMNGDAIFEMMRTYNGRTFRLREHLERLWRSAHLLRYTLMPYTLEELHHVHEALLRLHQSEHPEVTEWRTLIEVTRGASGIYEAAVAPYVKQVFITCYPLKWIVAPTAWKWTLGVNAHTISSRWGGPYAAAKHRSRLELDMAARVVATHGDEAVLLERGDWVLEAPGANVLMVNEYGIHTPADGCLPGITRDFVRELAAELGIPWSYRRIRPAELCSAREVFFSCTPLGVYPARRINGAMLPGPKGPVYSMIAKAFSERVGVDYEKQELIG